MADCEYPTYLLVFDPTQHAYVVQPFVQPTHFKMEVTERAELPPTTQQTSGTCGSGTVLRVTAIESP